VDDAEYVEDTILDDDVVHHAVVADAQAVERIGGSLDRPHLLATDAARSCDGNGKLLKAPPDPRLHRSRQLPVGARGRRRKQYLVRLGQPVSRSGRERPFR
jgi:hypothetical protein